LPRQGVAIDCVSIEVGVIAAGFGRRDGVIERLATGGIEPARSLHGVIVSRETDA
jgi:hypothetical protein